MFDHTVRLQLACGRVPYRKLLFLLIQKRIIIYNAVTNKILALISCYCNFIKSSISLIGVPL